MSNQDCHREPCDEKTSHCLAGVVRPISLDTETRTTIDTKLCIPVLLFFGTAIFWLILGSLLGLVCSLKLVIPSLFDGPAFLTYGRLFPVACDLLVYGWAIPAALGAILWMMARLSATSLPCTKILPPAIILWNLGVFFGSLAVLCGYSTSVEWLEYPNWASFILFVSFLLMSVWMVMLLRNRKICALYVSQWYFLAALCTFPWLYATANMLLTWGHLQGSAQGPVHAWYTSNLMILWLPLVALGTSYYLIPRVLGRFIASHYLNLLGFWPFLLFASWTAMITLLGGPIPAWMGSASVVASFLMIIPVVATILNYHLTMSGNYSAIVLSPTLRFVFTGVIFYIIFNAHFLLYAIPSVNAVFHFTDYTPGMNMLSLLGFFSMVMFGAIYYIAPRLLNLTWPSSYLIKAHFWLTLVGVAVMVISTTLGGLIEGIAFEDPVISFANIISYSAPWHWLISLSWILLLAANAGFGFLFCWMLWQVKNPALEQASFEVKFA